MRRAASRRLLLAGVLAVALAAPFAPAGAAGAPFVLTGEKTGDQAGYQVATGDLDGDGYEDLVVGAWLNDSGGADSGAVYVEYGPVRKGFSLAKADAKLYPPKAGDYAGEGPIGVLDLDGDGKDDLVVGAPGSFLVTQPGSPGKVGEAYVVYGGRRLRGARPLPQVAQAVFTGVQVEEWLGFGAAGVGDLDADGIEDLVVGAPATAGYSGAAYLFYGRRARFSGTVPVTTADATLVGGRATQMFGYEAEGGDVDGDGAADLVVTGGALGAPSPTSYHLWYGRKGARLTGHLAAVAADATLVAPGTTVEAGMPMPWVVADRDLTGDGVSDLVLGDGGTVNADLGSRAWIVRARPRVTGVVSVSAVAATTVIGAGQVVAAGDVTGDRRPDLVLGSPDEGAVRILRGPLAPGRIVAPKPVRPAEPATRLGAAVAVGDVTGDRRGDVLAGAPQGGAGYVLVLP